MSIFEIAYVTFPPVQRFLSVAIGYAWGAFYFIRGAWLMRQLRKGRVKIDETLLQKLAFPIVDSGEQN